VERDLEWLLNTIIWLPYELGSLPETRSSILTYGIPDFSGRSWRSDSDSRAIRSSIEYAIRTFEPRLLAGSVHVEILPLERVDEMRLQFRIDAILDVEPFKEPVSFDSTVDLDSGAIRIGGARP